MKIGINCGHTMSGQPGCGAVGFLDESVETRNVGLALIKLFRSGGHTVVDCTNDYASSTNENLSTIVSLANKQPLDLFVSIHFNAGGGLGTEVFTAGAQPFTEADNVRKNLVSLGFKNRGIKDGSSLYVIRRTNAKAMLIEVCFVDTDDAQTYRNIGYNRIAEAIYSAITGGKAAVAQTQSCLDRLVEKKKILNRELWSGGYTVKSHGAALIDAITGGTWGSEESDCRIHWAQPIIISLCGKKIIGKKEEWLTNPDAYMSKAQAMALIVNAKGGLSKKYQDRQADHWGRNCLDTLCDLGIITQETLPKWNSHFDGTVEQGDFLQLCCNAFGI